jgi:AraC-like DNA-binding protein
MKVLYDTRTVRPLDRYDYFRAGVAGERAPVEVRGQSPRRLLAVHKVARVGDFDIELDTLGSDSELVGRRTERLIRVGDPGCYRLCLGISGSVRMEQAGNRVNFGVRDIALYDLSRPFRAFHGTTTGLMRVIMLSFPRALVPITGDVIGPLVGTLMPRNLPGRAAVAQFLAGLAESADQGFDSDFAEVLRECTVGLIRQRLGRPHGMSPQTCRLLQCAHVRNIMRRHHGDPTMDLGRIAKAANMSARNLNKLFQDGEETPMQLFKRLRLEQCHRSLRDPAFAGKPIKDVIAGHGYRRSDQFARDFKQHFGVSATHVRRLAGQQRPELDR